MKKIQNILMAAAVLIAPMMGLATTPIHAAYVPSSFSSSSYAPGATVTYTLSFTLPMSLNIGKIGVSFANSYVDFSNASLSVTGISGCNAFVDYEPGISGNQDLQVKCPSVITTSPNTTIKLIVSNAKNPSSGIIGWDYISISDDTVANHDAFWSYNQTNDPDYKIQSNVYSNIVEPTPEPEPTPVPTPTPTPTPITPVVIAPTIITVDVTIIDIEINEWYYFEGSQTTDLSTIEDTTKVSNFTLDRMDLSMMTFAGEVDMSSNEAVDYIENVDDFVYFEYMYFWVSWEFWSYWETPLEVTFHDAENEYTENSDIVVNGTVLGAEDYTVVTTESGDKKVELSPEVIKEVKGESDKIEVKVQPKLATNLENFQDYIDLNTGILTVKGNVTDLNSKVFIVLNDEEIKVEYDENGNFETEIQLVEGRNTISAYATNEDGVFGKVEGAITYTAPAVDVTAMNDLIDFLKNNWIYFAIGAAMIPVVGLIVILGIFSLILKKNLYIAPFRFLARLLKIKK